MRTRLRLVIAALLGLAAVPSSAQYKPGTSTYDEQGRVHVAVDDTGRVTLYTYNPNGDRFVWADRQLIAVEKANGTVIAYAYDAKTGKRIQKRTTVPGHAPVYSYYPRAKLEEPPPVVSPAIMTITEPIRSEPLHVPSERELLSGAPEVERDQYGRISRVTSETGETTTYEYFDDDDRPLIRATTFPDGHREEYTRTAAAFAFNAVLPFMQPLSIRNDAEICEGTTSRVGFNGYFYSCTTKTYLTPSGRVYDPEIARFQQQDAYMGKPENPPSLHRYYYGYQNPTRYTDPSGHCPDGCDPLYNAPPEVQRAVEQAQREMIDKAISSAGRAARTGVQQVTRSAADIQKRLKEGEAVIVADLNQAKVQVEADARRISDAWGTSSNPGGYRLGLEYFTGTGPTHRDFGPGDIGTDELRRSPEIAAQMDALKVSLEQGMLIPGTQPMAERRNLKNEPRLKFLQAYTTDFVNNPTRNFVGSYSEASNIEVVSVDPANGVATVRFTVLNDSTTHSLTHLPPPYGYDARSDGSARPETTWDAAADALERTGTGAQRAVGTFVDDWSNRGPNAAVLNGAGRRDAFASAFPRLAGDLLPRSIVGDNPLGAKWPLLTRAPLATTSQTFVWTETVQTGGK